MTLVAPRPDSLGADLERRRLQHRAERLRRAVAALDDRALLRRRYGDEVPGPLREALAGFRAELDEVERRLAA